MKTILLTGGTGDLGSMLVKRLQRDYRCAVIYRSVESWSRLQSNLGATEDVAGVASLDEVPNFAPLYAVVHLAGGFASGSVPDDLRRMFDTNLMSAVDTIHAALAVLERNGRIVAISSAV